jgi:hypothetical protein
MLLLQILVSVVGVTVVSVGLVVCCAAVGSARSYRPPEIWGGPTCSTSAPAVVSQSRPKVAPLFTVACSCGHRVECDWLGDWHYCPICYQIVHAPLLYSAREVNAEFVRGVLAQGGGSLN